MLSPQSSCCQNSKLFESNQRQSKPKDMRIETKHFWRAQIHSFVFHFLKKLTIQIKNRSFVENFHFVRKYKQFEWKKNRILYRKLDLVLFIMLSISITISFLIKITFCLNKKKLHFSPHWLGNKDLLFEIFLVYLMFSAFVSGDFCKSKIPWLFENCILFST